jgi:hypothetical protein
MRARIGSKPQLYNDLGEVVNNFSKVVVFHSKNPIKALDLEKNLLVSALAAGDVGVDFLGPLFSIGDTDDQAVV